MLAVIGTLPADDEKWAFEVKWDGVRAITYVDSGTVHLESRNLLDITPRYPELTGLGAAVGRDAVLDGEVVAFADDGRPSFGRLQSRMHVANAREVRRRMSEIPVAYMLFDLLWLDGHDLMGVPYAERRARLEGLALDGGFWQVPPVHVGDGAAMVEATRGAGLEGVVAKRLASVYEPGRRSRSWVKVKNFCRQEVVIGGWLPGAGVRQGKIGALIAGYYTEERGGRLALRFAGKVGTGFTDAELDRLAARLAPIARPVSPFADRVPYKDPHFVEPRYVAEVDFTEWTSAGQMRHPSYKGLRDDKRAEDVRKETPG